MEDIKTATTALKAVVELGYPLELSRVLNYLENLGSKDELIQFDNEEALCSFLMKFPSMFWVEGGKVFPAQMKPKGRSRLPQSHPVVKPKRYSVERGQQDQPIGESEEQDEDKNIAPDSKVGILNTEDNGNKNMNQGKEQGSSTGEIRDDKEEHDKREEDDTQENLDMETLQQQAASHFIEVLNTKGPLPLTRIHGYIGSCPVQIRQAIPGGPVKIRELFLKYPNIFTVDTDDIVHLQPTLTAEGSDDDIDSIASISRDTTTEINVSHGKDRQEETNCGTKPKTGDFLNYATMVPSEETSRSFTYHAQEPQESEPQFPIYEATKESSYLTAVRNILSEQRKLSIVTIVEKLRALLSEDNIDERIARLFIKRHPDIFQLTKDDIVQEQAPVNVMGTITKVVKVFALATLDDGSQVYIPKALYTERMGVDCAAMKDHLSKGDCILLDTEPGMEGATGKWAATNIRAIFKSPNVHIPNDGTKKIDLHTEVPHLLATKATWSPSELDGLILNFVITFFNKGAEVTLQDLTYNTRYLNQDALLHLRSSGGLLKFLQGHPDKFQILYKHVVSVNIEHSQSYINTSNVDAECAAGVEASICPVETAMKETLHRDDKMSAHSDLPPKSEKKEISESMIIVHKTVGADNTACAIATKCVIGEIHSLDNDSALIYLQNGEKAQLSGLKQNVHARDMEPCLSVGDCILVDVTPGSSHSATQWMVSKVRHILTKAVPSQIQCSEATVTHCNVALKGIQQCRMDTASAMEEAKHDKTSKETVAVLSDIMGTVDLNITVSAKPSSVSCSSSSEDINVIECKSLHGTQDLGPLLEEGAVYFVEVLEKKGSMPLSKIHGHVTQLREKVNKAIGGGPENVRALFLKFPGHFYIDADDTVQLVSKQEENEACKQKENDIKSEAALLEEGTAHFVEVLEKKGSMPLSRINGHVAQCREEVRNTIGCGPEKVRALFLKFPGLFYIDADDTVHLVSKQEEENEASRQKVDDIKSEAALLEEGAAHFVTVLEKNGSIPLNRIHGHMFQCKKEVWKAIGGSQKNARSLFLKFPSYFHIDSQENVHLTSTVTQECIKAVSAILERKGPQQLGELISHVICYEPKISSFFEINSPKTFLEQYPKIFVIDEDDSMVYLVSAIKEEGVQHFKRVLKSKGSLHIKNLCGHSGQYKYLDVMRKVIGGSPSSVMDFLKGFPEAFSTDDEGIVHLTSATTSQPQGNKHGTENRTYAIVVETGKKIQTNQPIRSPLQENKLGQGKSASSTAVVHNQEKTSGKDNKENIQLEGVRHFKRVLESKGSMPVQNIWGHVNQCRDEVKWAIGCSVDKVKKFLRGYPDVFHIDDKLIVRLVQNKVNKQQQQQQHQQKSNINQLQIEQKALAHFKGMLSRKGPSTTHVLSSCFSSCGKDIRNHVGNSKEGLTKFFMKHPQIFKVDANNIVYLKGTSCGKVSRPQRWASCDTLAVPSSTVFPKSKLLSKLSGSTPDVRSTLCGGSLQQAEGVQGKLSQLPKEEYQDKDRTDSMAKCAEQHSQGQKLDMSNNIDDEYVTAVKNILSKKENLPLSKLVEELGVLFNRKLDLSGMRLFLKKHPDVFHVNNKDVVEELPPVNALAIITKVTTIFCFANLEDGSSVFMYIALYRERFGVDCHQLKDHLSPGDILLLDTEHSAPGSTTVKWAARSIKGLFKTSIAPSEIHRANLQMPMPYMSATTVTRSPAELDEAIVNVLSAFLRVKTPLQIDVLCFRMRQLNHDAVLYLREKGGLMQFIQAHPHTFQVDNEKVALTVGQPTSCQVPKKEDNSASVTKAGEGDNGSSLNNQSSEAKSIIGEVSTIANNAVHLLLPAGKAAILKLTNVQDSVTTSCLRVGDCMVAYVVPAPDQSKIPWVVSKVKHVMGKAAPAQIHAKAATATRGSHLLKKVLQQCVLEEDVDAVLAWHQLLSKKSKVSFEGSEECMRNLPKKAKMYILQKGNPCMFLEQYPTLFHVDRVRNEISLMECSPMRKMVIFDGAKRVKNSPAQVEGIELVTEKPSVDKDKEAVEFFRSKVLEKGQVSIHVLSSSFGFCPRDIRRHVGSSQKGLVKFFRDHPETFSLNEDDMMCSVKDASQTVKEQEKIDQIANTGSAVLEEGNGVATCSVQKDRDILPTRNASSSSCHHLFNTPVSHDIEMKPTVDGIDPVENHQEPDEEEEEEEQVDVERETSQLIFDLVQRCGEISFSALQGYVNLLGEDKQESIKDRGGLLSFLQHHHGQTFRIDQVSESIGLKKEQETRPDSLTNTADKEEHHSSTEAVVKMEKTNNSSSCDAENNQENQNIPIREPGDVSAMPLLKNSLSTEDKHNGIDVSTVVTLSELVTSETNVAIAASPDQTGSDQNQEQISCDSSTAVPTATVHPISVTNDSNSVPNTSDTENSDLSIDSKLNVAVQTEETGAHVSHTSTVEDMTALLPSSFDRSVVPPVRQEKTQAGTTSAPVQGKPLHLLVGEDGTHVWANSGEQDTEPLAAVCPAEFVVPGANPPGQPDDFTSLLPMFKDNLSLIQDNLVEVEMDIGRIPVARFYNPQTPRMLAATRLSDQTLTRETLETILFGLPLERSAIGQGRVLLRGTLHWISTLKNSLGEVVGLTLRRGQAVPGCLDLLWDVVTSGTSTLIMGRPCSGKTTLLREWARVLSDVCYRRVIVVDTLNEIAGGDDIPHAGIGGARRVQVHNRCDQVSHLQTAARNHSPDCIIVDEVQTQEEVTALQAIRLTGIQVIAGVCAGCLTDLLHNSVMRGLLGLSDPVASTSAPPTFPQTPSTSAPLSGTFPQTLPVFQAAVVIHSRDMVSVYSDVASFVRVSLLEGRFPLAQQRKRVVTKDRETEL